MGFNSFETERLRGCLARLLPHVRRDELALTGGVALELHLAAAGMPSRRRAIADLDLVARRLESVDASVSEEFLVCHYHVPQPAYPKFLFMVVDPVSRIRVDIFPDLVGSIKNARPVSIGDEDLLVLDCNSLLDHKLQTLSKASEAHPVDEKHYLDAQALAKLCRRDLPPVAAGCLRKEVYCTDLEARCPRCEASRDPAFPLSPKREIFAILGYV